MMVILGKTVKKYLNWVRDKEKKCFNTFASKSSQFLIDKNVSLISRKKRKKADEFDIITDKMIYDVTSNVTN